MKKVILSGYYGFNNIGDEAVLASIIQALQREIPEVQVTVLSNDPSKTEKQYGVKAVNRWSLPQIIPVLKGCDLFISGGGSLLQDVTGPKSIIYYLALIRLARFFRKPVMIYAQGIGPINRPWARNLVGRVLNKVNLITLRDEDSRADLASMGVTRPPIMVTADPVLGWENQNERVIPENLKNLDWDQGKFVGISLRHWPGLNPGELAELGDYLVKEGFQPIFLPFHFPGDISVCREVAKLMKEESYLIKDNLSALEMMDIIGKMDLVIGMRLHALIMSGAQGVPFVAISYDPKVERFTKQMGQTAACSVENMSCKDLKKIVEQNLENYSLIKEKLLEKGATYRKDAQETAKWAAKLMDNSHLDKGSNI
ncbi:MAG: polysaccharide pyruvyl transferase CsaB [Bacillota bacterium]|jgi:polysaccharide pyruvyl transferase CsaB